MNLAALRLVVYHLSMLTEGALDPELEAMQSVLKALDALEAEARHRVIHWAMGRFQIAPGQTTRTTSDSIRPNDEGGVRDGASPPPSEDQGDEKDFATLGELFAVANPQTNGQRALVVGYWLQSKEGQADLDAARINKELKHLGYGVANITTAMDELKGGKPALAIQLKKAGTSRQARKKYKVTEAGIRAVEMMLRAG